MIAIIALSAISLGLAGYLASRMVRYSVNRSPALRANILASIGVLIASLSVTEPFERVVITAASVAVPTTMKSVACVWCCGAVLLIASANESWPRRRRLRFDFGVYLVTILVGATLVLLAIQGGAGDAVRSVDYVERAHSIPTLQASMLISYVFAFVASGVLIAIVLRANRSTPVGRGLTITAVGSLLFMCWAVGRVVFLVLAWRGDAPDESEFVITKLLSLIGLAVFLVGLVWASAESDIRAWLAWRRFRGEHRAMGKIISWSRRRSDWRGGIDGWVNDRALELLDAEHLSKQIVPGAGLSAAGSDDSSTAIAAATKIAQGRKENDARSAVA